MNIKNIFLFPAVLLLFACGAPGNKKTPAADSPHKDSATEKTAPPEIKTGLSEFRNMEMSEFCILLPLEQFAEVYDSVPVKAHHTFIPKQKSAGHPNLAHLGEYRHIDVQAFIIDEKYYHSAKTFYENDRNDIEENNLAIDTSYALEDFYFIRGHMPNYEELQFVQMAWVRDDKIVLNVVYHADDRASWDGWLKEIMARGLDCGK